MVYYDKHLKMWVYDDNQEQYLFESEDEADQFEIDQRHTDFKTYKDYCNDRDLKPGRYQSLKMYLNSLNV
jgi:hypothetical protein